jgi:hypothetical protein
MSNLFRESGAKDPASGTRKQGTHDRHPRAGQFSTECAQGEGKIVFAVDGA